MKKYQKILLIIIIGFMVFPTITLGGTFVFSLIQGKSVEEAVQILAEQIDFLISRVETVEIKQSELETKQTGQEQTVSELQAKLSKEQDCREADRSFISLPPMQQTPTGEWIGRLVGPNNIVDLYNQTIDSTNHGSGDIRDLPIVERYYQNYLSAKVKCEIEK